MLPVLPACGGNRQMGQDGISWQNKRCRGREREGKGRMLVRGLHLTQCSDRRAEEQAVRPHTTRTGAAAHH